MGMNKPNMTQLEHLCSLNVDKPPHPLKKTGIICTIGPASRKVETLIEMIKSGMTIARLNFSHGTHEYHAESVRIIREAAAAFPDHHLAIALDTKGPEVRTGFLKDGVKEVMLVTGGKTTVTVDEAMKNEITAELVYLDYTNLPNVCQPGQNIFIDDGLIQLQVTAIDGKNLACDIVCGGPLSNKKGVNLSGIAVDLPAVSDTDEADLKFAVAQKLDMVFASFIRDAANCKAIKEILGEEGKDIQLIAKIENHQGVQNIDEILDSCEGMMVARGDLGVQIPQEKLTVAQKMLIAKCNRLGKPAICATQMMDSMTNKPRPTRAEIADVTNAVLDGADCVMLSGESAKGTYPIDTVRTMAQICMEAEKIYNQRRHFTEMRVFVPNPTPPTHATAISAVELSVNTAAAAIIVLSTTGQAARFMSRYRPNAPIVAVLGDDKIARMLRLARGVVPVVVTDETNDWVADTDRRVQIGIRTAFKLNCLKPGDPMIIVTGWKQGVGYSNTVRVIAAPNESALTVP